MKTYALALLIAISTFLAVGDELNLPPGIRCVEVSGQGHAEAIPDVAVLKLTAQVSDTDIRRAKSQVDVCIEKLLSLARDLKMRDKDVTATQLVIRPEYNRNEQSDKPGKSVVTRGVTLRIRELSQVPAAIDAAIAAGVNSIDGLELESSRANEIASDASVRAIADAQARAEAIAKHLKVKLGRVLRVSSIYSSFDQLVIMNTVSESRGELPTGTITADSTMHVVYEITD